MADKIISLAGLERFLERIKTNLRLRNPADLKLTLRQENLQTGKEIEVSYNGASQIALNLTPNNLGCIAIGDTVSNAEKANIAQSAVSDDKSQTISNTYIKKLEISGKELIITKGDNSIQNPNLIIPDTTYDIATNETAGLLSAIDKQKIDTIEWNANEYQLPKASRENLGGVKSGSEITDINGLFPCPIVDGIPYYGLTEYNLNKDALVAAEGIIKGENIIDGSKYENFSISYNDANDPEVEIAKLIMNKQGLTIFGDTATTGTITTTLASNDYAEYRDVASFDFEKAEPGLIFTECIEENDTIKLTSERLMPIPMVYSDTYGMLIGARTDTSIPIAVSGRVLVYTYEDRNSYNLGDAVCSAPDGKISKMTREEIKEWPDRILGYVSCIPEYDEWANGIEVKERIWIKIK